MREESLRWLVCPVPGCAGPLGFGSSFTPVRSARRENEILEAVLACGRCSSSYPVILGVALLELDLPTYLGAMWEQISSCAGATPLTRPMKNWLGMPSDFTGSAGPSVTPAGAADLTTPYLQAHFDPSGMPRGLPEGWWRDSVLGYLDGGINPYDRLLEDAEQTPAAGLAIEVGASTGGAGPRLAARHDYAIGIDRSFAAVHTARRYLLGEPEQLDAYPLAGDGRQERRLPPAPEAAGLDYVVADGTCLPIGDGGAGTAVAVNVLCAVGQPAALLAELARVLQAGGLLLLSTPYWSDEAAGAGPPLLFGPKALRRALGGAGFSVRGEIDMVPWLLRLATRRWNVYLCHCLTALRD